MPWISCKEKLPNIGDRVLINNKGYHDIALFEEAWGKGYGWYSLIEKRPLPENEVIHWMPLPNPPEDK